MNHHLRRLSQALWISATAAAILLTGCGDGDTPKTAKSPEDPAPKHAKADNTTPAEAAQKPKDSASEPSAPRQPASDTNNEVVAKANETQADENSDPANDDNKVDNQKNSPPKSEPQPSASPAIEAADTKPADFKFPAAQKPKQMFPPQVALSEEHAKDCLIKVGDAMPRFTLPDPTGQQRVIDELKGERLTVVLFWNVNHVYAREQFVRFKREVTDAFAGQGVAGVAIHVGQGREKANTLASENHVDFPCLLDETKEAFDQIAVKKLPRVYLLNSQGEVLWFDIEYSGSTRRQLRNAIWYHLGENAPR